VALDTGIGTGGVPRERWLTASTARLAHLPRPRRSLEGLAPPFHAAMTCYGVKGCIVAASAALSGGRPSLRRSGLTVWRRIRTAQKYMSSMAKLDRRSSAALVVSPLRGPQRSKHARMSALSGSSVVPRPGSDGQNLAHEPTFSGNVTHAFSSRLSSFRNRQSVPSAMILLGLDWIIPPSWSRNA
jgi:hypothetical protein